MKVQFVNLVSLRAAAFGIALATSSTAVHAYKVTEAQRKACTPDVLRLCHADIPHVDKIIACIKTNRSKLSPECEAVVAAALSATATRSIAADTAEWCEFTPGNLDVMEQHWKNWCGPAAH